MIQMYGQPYNQNTLKSVPPDEQARLNRVSLLNVPLNCEAPTESSYILRVGTDF